MNTLDELLAHDIRISVQEVFRAYLSMDAQPGPVRIKPRGQPYVPPDTEILAVVGYGGGIKGGIHLASPVHVACTLSGAFAGMELETMDDTARDAFGELANMVAGGVQSRLMDQHGFDEIVLTPPMVFSGIHHGMTYKKDFSSVRHYFKFAGGLFFLECFYIPDD
ncbi:MAG: chemotaxis protein CheX [Magnetococcales bacterium]|nr:chemotaxis protein CheX [Magnetococcales bacterium]